MVSHRAESTGKIPFNRPFHAPEAISYIQNALAQGALTGGGYYTERCHAALRNVVPNSSAYITTSCTSALEMAGLLLDLGPGDEVIMPSWTFPSTANCVALRGALPVFVDVRRQDLTIDLEAVASAITPHTRAIICVHYAGISCDMDLLLSLRGSANLAVIEDAAQAFGASWKGRPLGGIGDFGAFSFHGTKEISAGEGGAIIINNPRFSERAGVIWQKGTNIAEFKDGRAAYYEWNDIGSSFLPSELIAALLLAQMGHAASVLSSRRESWKRYDDLFRSAGLERFMDPLEAPAYADVNGHLYAIRLRDSGHRDGLIAYLHEQNIEVRTHYRPLHVSPAGRRLGRKHGSLEHTEKAAASLIRLPIDAVITADEQERVIAAVAAGMRWLMA